MTEINNDWPDAYRAREACDVFVAGIRMERGIGLSWGGWVGPFHVVIEFNRVDGTVKIKFGERSDTFKSLAEADDALRSWMDDFAQFMDAIQDAEKGIATCEILQCFSR